LVLSSTVVDCSAVVVVLVLVGLLGAQEWLGGAAIVEPCEMGDTRSGAWRGWKASALPAIASRSEVVARVDGNLMIVYLNGVT